MTIGQRQDHAKAPPGRNKGQQGRHWGRRRRAGFTLLEAALATVIIGTSFLGVMNLIGVCTKLDGEGAEQSTAVNLARNIREMTVTMQYANQVALGGVKYNPPKDSRGTSLPQMAGWEQVIAVQPVNPVDMTTNVSSASPSAVRMTVTVNRNGTGVYTLSWYVYQR